MAQRAFDRAQPRLGRHFGDDLLHEVHRGVFENSGRQTVRVPDNLAARWIGRALGEIRSAQGRGIGQSHVAVIADDEHRRAVGDVVNQRAGGQFRRCPALVVPVTAEYPFARSRTRTFSDAPREFRLRRRIFEGDAFKLGAAVNQVQVRVVETGDDAPESGVDHLGVGASPMLDLVSAADIGDSVADDRDRRGRRLLRIAGPDSAVGNDDVRRDAGRPRARRDNHGEREAGSYHSTHQGGI